MGEMKYIVPNLLGDVLNVAGDVIVALEWLKIFI